MRAAAQGLRNIGVEVGAVLASSYARVWQTAQILSEEAGWPAAEACSALEPPSPTTTAVEAVGVRRESALAVVGHQPQLSELASLLVCGSESVLRLEFKKGGVVCIRFADAPAAGEGTLRWSASPKMLRGLGR
jgi:phosphohistidine phosphatase